ncbi:MAG: hypothetical protein V4736_07590 [Bdellovibrionota bacterium]
MPRSKKGNEAPNLFDDLMDDLQSEDSAAVDSSDEYESKDTVAKESLGILEFNHSDESRDLASVIPSEGSMVGTRPAASIWNSLDEEPMGPVSNEIREEDLMDDSTLAVPIDGTVPVAQLQDLAKTLVHPSNKNRNPVKNKNQGRSSGETYTKFGNSDDKFVMSAPIAEREYRAHVSPDASLAQATTLQIAQDKILSMEKEVDRLRSENDDLAMAADIMRQRAEELASRVENAEREKVDIFEQGQSEITLLKGQLNYKDSELSKNRQKVEDLESRLRTDFKKIRVKERELENRLEIVKTEKQALLRAKDEQILELQRKMDQLKSELDHHRTKVQDMFKSIENKKDQMRKTVKALRLALTHLEAQSDDLAPGRKRD